MTRNNAREQFIVRLIVAALFTAALSGAWDGWWHAFEGRDTLFEPPHSLLYASAIIAILSGLYGAYLTKEKIWWRLAIILLVIPLSAPFDEFWHRLFGVENLSTPLIVWAPPHVALIISLIIAWFMILPLVRKYEKDEGQRFFGAISFAGILMALLFLAVPVQPIGPYQVLGFWGAGILAAIFSAVFLAAQKWMPGFGAATFTSLFVLVVQAVGFEAGEFAPQVTISPHAHSPAWLTIFALLIPAVLIDIGKNLPLWFRGAIVGFLWSFILYGFSAYFIGLKFQYTAQETLQAIGVGLIGGLIGGTIITVLHNGRVAQLVRALH